MATDRWFYRGNGPGHGADNPPKLSQLKGNGWAVGEWVSGAFEYRTADQMTIAAGMDWSHVVQILPQDFMDLLPWSGVAPETPAEDPIVDTILPRQTQAEEMDLVGAGIGDGPHGFGAYVDNPGSTGAGYVGWMNQAGEAIKDRLDTNSDKDITFITRYQTGDAMVTRLLKFKNRRTGAEFVVNVTLPTTGGWANNGWKQAAALVRLPRGEWDILVDANDTAADMDWIKWEQGDKTGEYPKDDPAVVTPPPAVGSWGVADGQQPPPPASVRTDFGGHDHGAGTSDATVQGSYVDLAVTHTATNGDANAGDRRVWVEFPDGKLDTRVETVIRYKQLPPVGSTQATSIYINRSGDDSDFSGGYGPHGYSISAQPDRSKLVIGRRSGFDAHDGIQPYDEPASVPFNWKAGVDYNAVIQRLNNRISVWVGEGAQPLNADGSPKWLMEVQAQYVDRAGTVQFWNHDGPKAPMRTTDVFLGMPNITTPVGTGVPPPPPPPPPVGGAIAWPITDKLFGWDAVQSGIVIESASSGCNLVRVAFEGPTFEWVGHNKWPNARAALQECRNQNMTVLAIMNRYGATDADGWARDIIHWLDTYGREFGTWLIEVGNETWGGNPGWYIAPAVLARTTQLVHDWCNANGMTKVWLGLSRQPFNQPGYQDQTDTLLGGKDAVAKMRVYNAVHPYGFGVPGNGDDNGGNWGWPMLFRSYQQTAIPTFNTESGWPTNGGALGAGPAGANKYAYIDTAMKSLRKYPWLKGWSYFERYGWGVPDDWGIEPVQVGAVIHNVFGTLHRLG